MSAEINQRAIQLIAEDLVPSDVLEDLLERFSPQNSYACIERAFCGGIEWIDFEQFEKQVIQDTETAIQIARQMLYDGQPYEFNAEDPEFREEFNVTDIELLQQQLAEAERLFG